MALIGMCTTIEYFGLLQALHVLNVPCGKVSDHTYYLLHMKGFTCADYGHNHRLLCAFHGLGMAHSYLIPILGLFIGGKNTTVEYFFRLVVYNRNYIPEAEL